MKIYICLLVFAFGFLNASAGAHNFMNNAPVTLADSILIKAYLTKGKQLEESIPDSATYYYKQAINLATKLKDTERTGSSYLHLFISLFRQSKYAEAFELARTEINIGKKWNSDVLQMKGYNNLAIAYQYLSDYETATRFYLKAAEMANKMGDEAKEAKIFENMASLSLKLKNYKTALDYGLRSYQLSKKRNDSLFMISGLITIGAAEEGLESFDSALVHLNEAKTICYQINENQNMAVAEENMGLIYAKMNKPILSVKSFQKALTIAQKYNYPFIKATSLNGLANTEVSRGNYDVAEKYASDAITIGEKEDLGAELAEMYNNMSAIQQKQGKYADALKYKNLYEAINDSLMNVQIRTNITRLNIQYQTAGKDKEILEQKLLLTKRQSNIQKKNILLLLAIVILTALITILFVSFRNYSNKKKLHHQTVVALQKEQEVIRLKALMEGKDEERQRISKEMHDDIGSGLTTILFLSNHLKNDLTTGEKIANNANTLIGKMNEIIWSMNTDYDTLEDLVTYLRQHAGEMLESADIQYHFHIPPTIPRVTLSGEQRRNIYLVVKESLHNIIKHAQAQEVNLTFQFDQYIHIVVCDNGKGFNEERIRCFGNGLKNMKQRMESIGGSFHLKHNQGVTITLIVPIEG